MLKEQPSESKIEEIETVSKELYHSIVSWVKMHPLLTLLFSFLLSVASNLLSQWIWNLFY